jgi:restriction system protein
MSELEAVNPVDRVAFLTRQLAVVLSEKPEGYSPPIKAIKAVEKTVTLTPQEKKRVKSGRRKFDSIIYNAAALLQEAKWLLKDKYTTWKITDEGERALEDYPDPAAFRNKAKEFTLMDTPVDPDPPDDPPEPDDLDAHGDSEEKTPDEENIPEKTPRELKKQERSWTDFYERAVNENNRYIREHLLSMGSADFEQLVQALLRAMGYYVHWTAPTRGADGGVDIVAHKDPLGLTSPRIKVQCKRWRGRIGLPEIKSFVANIEAHDAGIMVCIGGFTAEAEAWVRTQSRQITLIDQDKLVEIWTSHSHNLKVQDLGRFPLTPVFMLTPPS